MHQPPALQRLTYCLLRPRHRQPPLCPRSLPLPQTRPLPPALSLPPRLPETCSAPWLWPERHPAGTRPLCFAEPSEPPRPGVSHAPLRPWRTGRSSPRRASLASAPPRLAPPAQRNTQRASHNRECRAERTQKGASRSGSHTQPQPAITCVASADCSFKSLRSDAASFCRCATISARTSLTRCMVARSLDCESNGCGEMHEAAVGRTWLR
eukprot:3053549-Prymnesium_polylepis.1